MYYVYILQSVKTGKLYVGHTDNLSRSGKYTRKNGPWKLAYSEKHPDRSSAAKRELYLKSTRGSYEKRKLAGTLPEESDSRDAI